MLVGKGHSQQCTSVCRCELKRHPMPRTGCSTSDASGFRAISRWPLQAQALPSTMRSLMRFANSPVSASSSARVAWFWVGLGGEAHVGKVVAGQTTALVAPPPAPRAWPEVHVGVVGYEPGRGDAQRASHVPLRQIATGRRRGSQAGMRGPSGCAWSCNEPPSL